LVKKIKKFYLIEITRIHENGPER